MLMTLDGFATGEGQTLQAPFGHATAQFHDWFGRTRGRRGPQADGTLGPDEAIAAGWGTSIGAEIMGRNKFGPQRGPWENDEWRGWWGDEPPFHTPVFVLTHHARPSFSLSDTTFHFLNATPSEALRIAKDAANGKDVRIGGGVATVRAFLDADLIDEMHVVVAPFDAGKGERLWETHDQLRERFHVESVPSPSGVTHLTFTRRPAATT